MLSLSPKNTIENNVEQIIKHIPHARNNYNWLIREYLELVCKNDRDLMPSIESITRAYRGFIELYPEWGPDPDVAKSRNEREARARITKGRSVYRYGGESNF